MTKRVYLIGFMGSGKSTMGRWLADVMEGWSFLDLDVYLENKYHKTIPDIFSEKGEQGFRQMESACLQEVSSFEHVIIGAGGGTPCFYSNMEVMNNTGLTIYLKLSPKDTFDRLQTSKNPRPLIQGKEGDELIQFIADKVSEREKYYNQAQIIADAKNWEVQDYIKLIKE